ncbi:clavesin-2-like [Topomyia yanbarensis]|uniref:clavesin-2-like n=1 Tax=Topomyia yanbarensis TaxID=2498891 RepID=UPI00273CE8E7|nr:clavesin-2-like [Topomyia yanbarensis]
MTNVPVSDKYCFTLSDQYGTLARDELRESDEIRDQSLAQIRDWIAKNAAIKFCRSDSSFLLRFLRVRKFNHLAACESVERYLVMRQRYADWFRKLDTTQAWVDEMIDDWPILPLGYDEIGRLLILIKMGNFDLKKFVNVDQIRMMMMILESYYEEERVQIAGSVFILDSTGLTMSHIAQWPLSDIKNFVDCVNHTFPLRIKEVHTVNLPRYAIAVSELCVSFASPKLKKRIHCHRSIDDLIKHVKLASLPKEYGGEVPINTFKHNLRVLLSKHRSTILNLDQMAVDLSTCLVLKENSSQSGLKNDSGVVGSFRKLNVD